MKNSVKTIVTDGNLAKSRFPNFGIRSTISETMDFVAKSRFVSLYEYFANRIRITSVTDVKKIRLTLLCNS